MIETYNEDTTHTTIFLILTETFKHTIFKVQRQHPVPRLKMEDVYK